MAAVTPSSDLYLLQCPIEIDNKNQINFANTTNQYNYFFGLNKIGATNFSYQRKDSTIRYPAHIDSIRHFNYVMYRNDNYSNKWFYAFIEEMEYLNDSTTLIKIKTDVYQTWQFDLTFKRCFVEREHVNDDTAGKHTLDEGLSVGEPMMNTNFDYRPTYQSVFVAQVTQLPDGVNPPSEPTYQQRVYNSIPQGCYFIIMDQASSLAKFSKWYDKKGQQNAIVSMFIIPGNLVLDAVFSNYNIGEGIGSTRLGFMPSTFGASNIATLTAYRSSTLNGYTPKNNKLFTYPYMYLTVSNNSGSNGVYKYEDFVNPSETKWKVVGALTQGGSIKVYPEGYKNAGTNMAYDYGISWGKYPVISWSSDYYLNWQAQNGRNHEVQAAVGLGKDILSGIGSGADIGFGLNQNNSEKAFGGVLGVGEAGLNIVSDISAAMHDREVAKLVPDMARGNVNCGDINYSMNKTCVTFACMSCRREYAVMIDSFFSMFGYKVNEVKVPNISGRSNWNFVKTKQCNVLGNIPQEDLDEIKAMFDSGITIWHKTAYFLDYSQNNPIV